LAVGSAGAEPFNFLFLDANARPVGMGGAYTALAADENALLYNPAGLGRIASYGATFMHNKYLTGIAQEYAAFVSPQGFGANLNFLDSGDIPRTTYARPAGGLGDAGLSDIAFSAGYGRALGEFLSVGAGRKYIREAIDHTPGDGWALDFGGLYAVPAIRGLTLGLAAQNLGPTVKFEGAHENLPLNVRTGAAYGFNIRGHKSVIALDVTKERSQSARVAVGAESGLWENLALRFGFNSRNDAGIGIAAGFGYQWRGVSIDYAFVPMGELGDAHRVSVTVRWGGVAPSAAKTSAMPAAPDTAPQP